MLSRVRINNTTHGDGGRISKRLPAEEVYAQKQDFARGPDGGGCERSLGVGERCTVKAAAIFRVRRVPSDSVAVTRCARSIVAARVCRALIILCACSRNRRKKKKKTFLLFFFEIFFRRSYDTRSC